MSSVSHRLLTVEQQKAVQYNTPAHRARTQLGVLIAFLLVSLLLYGVLSLVAPQLDQPIESFMLVWGGCFLVYLCACVWILKTRPLKGRLYWYELGLLLLGAVVFRVMLIHLPLGLSRDAWRYLWDGKMIVHGFSPYQYAPNNPLLMSLRDSVYHNVPYFQSTTKYPPGAELFYVLGYLLTPTSLLGMKSLFVLCDSVTCFALALLLRARGRDMRYAIIYAWSPLPIVEFAVECHVDALVIACTMLAILFAVSTWRYARLFAGIFLALATLTKLYPIVLLLLIMRRRDWSLLIGCGLTLVMGYLPFFALSHGNILAASPLSSVIGQRDDHIGVIQNVLYITGMRLHHTVMSMRPLVLVIELALLSGTLLFVVVQRLRHRLSLETGVLLLTWVILVDYAHVFPWYAPALLPWVALCIVPLWSANSAKSVNGFNARGLAVLLIWYFTCTCILSYLPVGQYSTQGNWLLYYDVTFGVILTGFLVAVFFWLRRYAAMREATMRTGRARL